MHLIPRLKRMTAMSWPTSPSTILESHSCSTSTSFQSKSIEKRGQISIGSIWTSCKLRTEEEVGRRFPRCDIYPGAQTKTRDRLNVFVTPDLEPIFGGTYWPGPKSERAKQAGTGFEDIILKVSTAWREQEQRCRESARDITRQLREFARK